MSILDTILLYWHDFCDALGWDWHDWEYVEITGGKFQSQERCRFCMAVRRVVKR